MYFCIPSGTHNSMDALSDAQRLPTSSSSVTMQAFAPGVAHQQYKSCPVACQMPALYTCKTCGLEKEENEFSGIKRSFYFCRRCCNKRSTERRRSDPACRIISRARSRAARAREPVLLDVVTLRRWLDVESKAYVDEDLIDLVKQRPDEPLGEKNFALVKVGRLVNVL